MTRHRSVASAHVAARGEAYVGCSGWSYPHWRGTIYDPAMRQKDWFSDYARRFRTVEVNNTFYKLPEAATFSAWRAQAPAGFIFALKLNQYGTHRRRLREPRAWLGNFVERAVLLGPPWGRTWCSYHLGGIVTPTGWRRFSRRPHLSRLAHISRGWPVRRRRAGHPALGGRVP